MKRLPIILALLMAAAPTRGQESESQSGTTSSFSPVTWERLLNAADEPENWLMYSGTLDSQHYSGLDQVHNRNVGELELKWAYQIPQLDRSETVPVVVDGVMFITEAPSNVVAVDAATGRQFWRYNHELPDDLRICCGRNNRGVAVLGDRLFMSTLDAHLVALDARNGNLLWDVEVADAHSGYSKTAAPLVVGDKVITGIAGGEFGIRGFVDAYDAKTGKIIWDFDALRDFKTVNGISAKGGSFSSTGVTVANGMIYVATGFDRPHLLAIDPKELLATGHDAELACRGADIRRDHSIGIHALPR